MPVPSGLVRTRRSPTDSVGVAQNALRVRATGDGQAELELFVDDAVAADDDRARPRAPCPGRREESRSSTSIGSVPAGKADDVQRGERLAAHRVDVRQRVRRGDLPEEIRIVDDRREKIDRLNEREIVGQA